MNSLDLLDKVTKLPVQNRIDIIEKTLISIKQELNKNQMQYAAEQLFDDYANNSSLTEFTNIDADDFYEAK
jgi:hypothetical protein